MTRTDKGFIYIWALFSVALLGLVLAGVGQVWQTKAQREKEKELLFAGDQFRKAITSYYNSAGDGMQQLPKSLEDLLLDRRSSVPKRHLRRIFPDPMTNSYEWGLVKDSALKDPASEDPASEQAEDSGFLSKKETRITGIYSLSKKIPLKRKNFPKDYSDFSKANSYQDWKFIYSPQDTSSQSESPQPEKN